MCLPLCSNNLQSTELVQLADSLFVSNTHMYFDSPSKLQEANEEQPLEKKIIVHTHLCAFMGEHIYNPGNYSTSACM